MSVLQSLIGLSFRYSKLMKTNLSFVFFFFFIRTTLFFISLHLFVFFGAPEIAIRPVFFLLNSLIICLSVALLVFKVLFLFLFLFFGGFAIVSHTKHTLGLLESKVLSKQKRLNGWLPRLIASKGQFTGDWNSHFFLTQETSKHVAQQNVTKIT